MLNKTKLFALTYVGTSRIKYHWLEGITFRYSIRHRYNLYLFLKRIIWSSSPSGKSSVINTADGGKKVSRVPRNHGDDENYTMLTMRRATDGGVIVARTTTVGGWRDELIKYHNPVALVVRKLILRGINALSGLLRLNNGLCTRSSSSASTASYTEVRTS